MEQQQGKHGVELVERTTTTDDQMQPSKGGGPLMRSKADEIGIWRSVLLFKRAGCIAMIAAFCAALDGYRKTPIWQDLRVKEILIRNDHRNQPQWGHYRQ